MFLIFSIDTNFFIIKILYTVIVEITLIESEFLRKNLMNYIKHEITYIRIDDFI